MRNHSKDRISDSSGADSEDDVEASEVNGSHLDNSRNFNLTVPDSGSDNDSGSDSGDNLSANSTSFSDKNLNNEARRKELPETDVVESSQKDVISEKKVSVKSIFNFEDLTADDEIYTLQCPAVYNKQALCGKNLGCGKPKQGDISETDEFQFEFVNFEKKFINLAVPKKSGGGALLKLPLRGHIIIQKGVDVPVSDMPEGICDNNEVVFPEDIKTRHPLLGVDWETHIKLANEAIKKRHHTKKSKAKKAKIVESIEEPENIKQESSEIETPSKKRKKKHE